MKNYLTTKTMYLDNSDIPAREIHARVTRFRLQTSNYRRANLLQDRFRQGRRKPFAAMRPGIRASPSPLLLRIVTIAASMEERKKRVLRITGMTPFSLSHERDRVVLWPVESNAGDDGGSAARGRGGRYWRGSKLRGADWGRGLPRAASQ